jgi:transposase
MTTETSAALPEDIEALKALVLEQRAQLVEQRTQLELNLTEIEHLKLLIAKLKRMQFGRSSERLDREIEQYELRLEELQSTQAQQAAPAKSKAEEKVQPVRRPLPEHLPREQVLHQPACTCPDCGAAMRKIGEDVSEVLDYVPARFRVIRHVRPKLACTACERIVQVQAPSRPIARGLAGPGLLAHVLVSKYADHLPLYRQAQIYAREGVDLERSTLAEWVGGCSRLVDPLIEALARYVMAAGKLHADDTPVPVLDPGRGRTKTGRLWTYVRDDRPAASTEAPAVLFRYSPDRRGERPREQATRWRTSTSWSAMAARSASAKCHQSPVPQSPRVHGCRLSCRPNAIQWEPRVPTASCALPGMLATSRQGTNSPFSPFPACAVAHVPWRWKLSASTRRGWGRHGSAAVRPMLGKTALRLSHRKQVSRPVSGFHFRSRSHRLVVGKIQSAECGIALVVFPAIDDRGP